MRSGVRNGENLFGQFVATGKRVVKSDEVTVSFGGQVFFKARFAVNPGTSPKSMDYTMLAGPDAGKQQLGIYEFEGDILRVCYSQSGSPRPTDFSSSPNDNRTIGEWTRKS